MTDDADGGRSWLLAAAAILRGDDAHHARCVTACLVDLLTCDARDAMGRGLLRRRLALQVLDDLLARGAA